MFEIASPYKGLEPLDYALNAAVLTLANANLPLGWDVIDSYTLAPNSLADINRFINNGRLAVWSGSSEDTIYGCTEHNGAFRAWHDAVHYKLQAPFTIGGEAAVVYEQIRQLVDCYGDDEIVVRWCAYMLSEVLGQALFNARYSEFPLRQRVFVVEDHVSWLTLAQRLVLQLGEGSKTRDAMRLARETWGKG